MDRRRLIISGASALGSVGLAKILWPAELSSRLFNFSANKSKSGLIFSGASPHPPKEGHGRPLMYTESIEGSVVILDLENGLVKKIPVPLLGHGFSFDQKKNLAVTSQKWGTNAVVVDLKSYQVLKEIVAPKGNVFFGHSCFFDQDKYLVMSSQTPDVYGSLLIYETKDWKLTREIRMPRMIHEVIALSPPAGTGGKESLLVALSRRQIGNDPYALQDSGILQEVDFATGALGASVGTMEASHILPLGKENYLVSGFMSMRDPMSVSLVNLGNQVRMDITDAGGFNHSSSVGEALSLARLDREHLVITGPDSHCILIWNIHRNTVATFPSADQPHGVIAFDDSSFLISHHSGDLVEYLYDTKTAEISRRAVLSAGAFSSGKHLYHLAHS